MIFPIFAVDTISVMNYVYILDINSDGMKDNYRKSEKRKRCRTSFCNIILYVELGTIDVKQICSNRRHYVFCVVILIRSSLQKLFRIYYRQ